MERTCGRGDLCLLIENCTKGQTLLAPTSDAARIRKGARV